MKKYAGWAVSFLLVGLVGSCTAWGLFGPVGPVMSHQGKISRASAVDIAPSYTNGQILQVIRSDRFTTSYLIESKSGSRLTIPVADGQKASEWQFCTTGDHVVFSVRDFPMGPPAQGDAGMDSVAYYLVPTCSR